MNVLIKTDEFASIKKSKSVINCGMDSFSHNKKIMFYLYLIHGSQYTEVTETVVAIYLHAERRYNPDCQ